MPTMQSMDDKELVQIYINGNESALPILIDRHQQRVFSYILKVVKNKSVADDIFQDTFIKVIHTLKQGKYKEEGKFLPWLLRIAHNLTIDFFRREKRMPTISTSANKDSESYDVFNFIGTEDKNKEEELIEKQLFKDVRALVTKLPFEQREVLIMRHYFEMSFKEISDKTDVSINTALGRMRYALINLRKMMEEKELVSY
jgi:RNA polymerase sigma factor (sigma-70 family)